jgi:transposase
MTYLEDLRQKAIEYLNSGHTQLEAATVFGITSRTIWNWIQRKKKDSLKPKSYERPPRKKEKVKQLKNLSEAVNESFLDFLTCRKGKGKEAKRQRLDLLLELRKI